MSSNTYYHIFPGIWPGIAVAESKVRVPRLPLLGTSLGTLNPPIRVCLDINFNRWPKVHSNEWNRYGFYYINPKSDQIYLDYPLGPLRFRLLVNNLNNSTFEFCTNQAYWRFPTRIGSQPHALTYLSDLVQIKLIQQGYILLHGAALSAGRQAALIVAPSETGKTVTSLLGMQKGYGLVAEDLTVSDGTFLFPAMSAVCPKVYSAAFLNSIKGLKPSIRRLAAKGLRILGLGTLEGHLLGTEAVIVQSAVEVQPVRLTHIFFLSKGEDFCITLIEKREARRRLEHIHKAEFLWRGNPLIHACAYFNLILPNIELIENDLLNQVVERSNNCFVCQSPTPYKFIELIQKEFPLSSP